MAEALVLTSPVHPPVTLPRSANGACSLRWMKSRNGNVPAVIVQSASLVGSSTAFIVASNTI